MRRRGERGETLAEVLVSTTLLGIIGIGIIGAIASVLISTDIDRRVSAGETVLRSYAAAITSAPYESGATAGSGYVTVDYTPPRGYVPSITSITCWDGGGPQVMTTSGPGAAGSLDTSGSCSGADQGLQKLQLQVVAGTGRRATTEHLVLYKRDTP